jgi:choline dehydrogenase-like flavoprotein
MDFDIIIIGSGAGGGMAALRLCEQGFNVGLLERGPRFDPRKDYIMNYPDWERRNDPLKHAQQAEQTIDQDYRTEFAHSDKQVLRSPLRYFRVHGVGGSTLHYQGEAHRFAEHAFRTNSEFGWGVDWPIGYSDLAPYYAQAEQLLGVAGAQGNPFKPEREAFPTPAHSLSAKSQIMAAAASKAGFSLLPNTLALPSRSIDGRTPCQHSGTCNYGCVFQAKSSIDQAIIPQAEKTGKLTLLSETRVLNLNIDDAGEVSSVNCVDANGTRRLSAKRYVLAGGAVETPRLMLASTSAAQANGLGNNNDQVGRYFMETVYCTAKFALNSDAKTYTGPPLDARVWDFCKPQDKQTNGFVLGLAGYLHPSIGPSNHAIRTAGIGRSHLARAKETFGRDIYVFGVAEQEPLASNRLTLSDKIDKRGQAKIKVHCEYSERDKHTIDVVMDKLHKWVSHAPSDGIMSTSDTLSRSAATHVGGTCRMGNEASTSVVDSFGKVHGQKNCYIADASVLPTQGAGDSPSLTIQALALRTADRIASDLENLST